MMRKYKLIIVMIVLATLFGACSLPIEVVSQQQAAAPTQAQPVVVQDDTSAQLIGTIAALETQLADSGSVAKAVEDQASATPVPTETPVAGTTSEPANVATSTSIPTATPAATATPVNPTTYPPIVYITPIQPFQPYNSPYNYQPYYPYNQSYPYQQQGYSYYYDHPYPANYYANAPCNRATFIADVNVPDNTNFAGGTSFTKTWRLRNDGSCTWTTGYSLVFDHGYALGGPSSVSIPADVAPGATVDLSVNLTAPSDSGIYQGYWKLQDASGNRFGIGRDASVAFWVKISVGGYYYNNYSYYNPPYYYPQPYVSGSCDITAISPAMYSSFDPNSDIDVKWTVRNTSGSTWQAANVDYKYISGTEMYKNSSAYDLGSDITSGATTDIVVDTKLPSSHGVYTMTWGVVDGSTRLCTMSITLYVR